MEGIISALIAGGLALIGVVVTNLSNNRQIENQLSTAQAITDTKIMNLTEEVKRHNEFWMKVPVLESRVEKIEETLKEIHNEVVIK